MPSAGKPNRSVMYSAYAGHECASSATRGLQEALRAPSQDYPARRILWLRRGEAGWAGEGGGCLAPSPWILIAMSRGNSGFRYRQSSRSNKQVSTCSGGGLCCLVMAASRALLRCSAVLPGALWPSSCSVAFPRNDSSGEANCLASCASIHRAQRRIMASASLTQTPMALMLFTSLV